MKRRTSISALLVFSLAISFSILNPQAVSAAIWSCSWGSFYASGPDADTINAFKSTADAQALDAVAAFYSGLAQLERLDTTKFAHNASRSQVASELAKVKAANEFFSKSSQGFLSAGGSCRAFKATFTESERVALLTRDINGFEEMSAAVKKISQQIDSGTLPDLGSVHATMSLINDALIYSKMRAVAHKGMPGHFPSNPVKFPNR